MNRTVSALGLILAGVFSLSAQDGKNAPPEIPSAFDLDTTIRVAEAASVAGAGFALAAAMPRRYEPRNVPPDRG